MEEVRNEVQNEEPETGKENESKSERFIQNRFPNESSA